MYSTDEIMQYIEEEDVKFVRLAFTDVYGRQKNVSVTADELQRAVESGIAFDASAIEGFGDEVRSDLFLFPDLSTISVLPWRPEHGKVVRMFSAIKRPNGNVFEADTREILRSAVQDAEKEGVKFSFGAEMEFYLFKRDADENPTKIPYDNAGYMDVAPDDKGENVRREICLTLERMGIRPESSHHEEGPGQNEIDFRYSSPISAADDAITFRTVVNTIAARNGLFADFSPKPLENAAGSGMHINFSAKSDDGKDVMPSVIAGILARIKEITAFLNTSVGSYSRLGCDKAPKYVSWSSENRSQLIRIPAASGEYKRAELRSADTLCNPYIAYALLIRAGLEGIKKNLPLPSPADINFYTAPKAVTEKYDTLPETLDEAKAAARNSEFVKNCLPESVIKSYTM